MFPKFLVSRFKRKGKGTECINIKFALHAASRSLQIDFLPRRYITQPPRRRSASFLAHRCAFYFMFSRGNDVCFIHYISVVVSSAAPRLHRWIQITENNSSIKMHKEPVSFLPSARMRVYRLRGRQVGEYKIVSRKREIEKKTTGRRWKRRGWGR